MSASILMRFSDDGIKVKQTEVLSIELWGYIKMFKD